MRALLIYAALACLCASDGVGPRLLPYPTLGAAAEGIKQRSSVNHSTADRRDAAASGEVTHRLSKAGDAFKKLPVFAAPASALNGSATARRKATRLAPPLHINAAASLRFGRAPPLHT